MESRRSRNLRNNFDRNMLDKQVDKIFETGRQFVDGVSGTRPGKRRNSDFQEISRRNAKKVGRWVSDKMDLFFDEDDEDWYDDDNNYEEKREIKSFSRQSKSTDIDKQFSKRPLEALSLRQSHNIKVEEQKKLPFSKSNVSDEWPDDSHLKVDRWHRSDRKELDIDTDKENQRIGLTKGRRLPKSRRGRI